MSAVEESERGWDLFKQRSEDPTISIHQWLVVSSSALLPWLHPTPRGGGGMSLHVSSTAGEGQQSRARSESTAGEKQLKQLTLLLYSVLRADQIELSTVTASGPASPLLTKLFALIL